MDEQQSLQDRFAPNLTCFGCGPANEKGLQIKSFVRGDEVVCTFNPQSHHQAYQGMVNGGIIGALLDCHMNWAATWHLMNRNSLETPPCTVTAEFTVKFKAPTPFDRPLELVAKITDSSDRRANTFATISADGVVTAEGTGIFVAVKEGHPAYHRW
ncbi:MAG: PaaI family thioesterase [Planctomycetota bacterium]